MELEIKAHFNTDQLDAVRGAANFSGNLAVAGDVLQKQDLSGDNGGSKYGINAGTTVQIPAEGGVLLKFSGVAYSGFKEEFDAFVRALRKKIGEDKIFSSGSIPVAGARTSQSIIVTAPVDQFVELLPSKVDTERFQRSFY